MTPFRHAAQCSHLLRVARGGVTGLRSGFLFSVGHETGPASGGMVGRSSHGEQPPTPGGIVIDPATTTR